MDIYGKVRTFAGRSLNECPFRYQGQYEDVETGLYYNRFRYYSPDEGMYLSQDPIGLNGGMQLYGYVNNPNFLVDKFGLVDNSVKPNQDVYALYKKGAKEPYYIGISQDADVRLGQHTSTGRFDPATDEMRVLQQQVPYAQARANEQFNIEKYNTIDKTNLKANQQNSFRKTEQTKMEWSIKKNMIT